MYSSSAASETVSDVICWYDGFRYAGMPELALKAMAGVGARVQSGDDNGCCQAKPQDRNIYRYEVVLVAMVAVVVSSS